MSEDLPARIVAEARTWIGVPFAHQGRTRHGVDCVGLCRQVLAACGIVVEDVTDYPQDPDGRLLRVLAERLGPPVHAGKGCGHHARIADIAVIAFPHAERHVGIVADYRYGGLSLIHTWNGTASVSERQIDERWRRRIVALHRVVETMA